jgi:hypothetical protein
MLRNSITPTLWSRTLTTNLTGAFNTVQAAATQLSIQSPPGGSIIGISSISALVGGAQQVHYTPTKAGVLSLIQSCACALGKYNIRCNALLPGTIRTQLNEEDLANEEKRTYMEGRIPLGRTGVPQDLVGPAVFLGSELSGYMVSTRSIQIIFCVCVLTMDDRLVRNCWLTVGCLLICSKDRNANCTCGLEYRAVDVLCPVRFSGFCAVTFVLVYYTRTSVTGNLSAKLE